MEKMKQKIVDFLKNKEKVHLKDIYQQLEVKPASIRATINLSIKKQDGVFERLGKGNYKLVANITSDKPTSDKSEAT